MRRLVFTMLIAGMIFCSGAVRGWSQNPPAGQSSEKRDSTYRIDFSINELEDGKKLNARHYSMNLIGGNPRELKIGTRVPVEIERGKFEYLDIGTSVRAKMFGSEESPILEVTVDISNFATNDQNTQGGRPLLRQMVISGSTVVLSDKPVIIGTVDDPNSTRQFQLEVTATRLNRGKA